MISWQRMWNDDGSAGHLAPIKIIAYILSQFYRPIIFFRNRFYDWRIFRKIRLPCPVISVGNLTVGGTGKTPCVILLAQMLSKHGYRPAVLSRGYGSRGSGQVNIVSNGKSVLLPSESASDEPLLIASALGVLGVPVITGPKRALTGSKAIEKFAADVLICDDAFQHRQLHRDINIVLLDNEAPLGNGYLLPRGSLREPVSSLGRADVIIATRCENTGQANPLIMELVRNRNIPVFSSRHRATEVVSGDYRQSLPLTFLQNKKICAFAGIANPDSFKKTILDAGAQIVAFEIFRDHHRFNSDELKAIRDRCFQSGADLILTTEKDGMRLRESGDFLSAVYLLRISMEITSDEESLVNWLLAKLPARTEICSCQSC